MKLLALLAILVFGAAAHAQTSEEEALLLNFQAQKALLDDVENASFIAQSGSGNEAYSQLSGEQVVAILQQGDFNLLNFVIGGNGNRAIAEQQGSNNELDLNLTGDGNEVNLIQQGNFNKVSQNLQDVNNLDIDILQIGDGHEVIQSGNNISDRPISIVQQGTPMQVTITSHGGN